MGNTESSTTQSSVDCERSNIDMDFHPSQRGLRKGASSSFLEDPITQKLTERGEAIVSIHHDNNATRNGRSEGASSDVNSSSNNKLQ